MRFHTHLYYFFLEVCDNMVTKVDFASPIMDNRQEVIAVKFGGALKNVCEMMFYAAMANDPQKWIKKYPGLDHLRRCNTIVERFEGKDSELLEYLKVKEGYNYKVAYKVHHLCNISAGVL